jgi:hypothetical protein
MENQKKISRIAARIGAMALAAAIALTGAFADFASPARTFGPESVYGDTIAANALEIKKDSPQRVVQGAGEEFGLTVTNKSQQEISYSEAVINIDDTANRFNISVSPTGQVTLKPGEQSHIAFKITARKNVTAKNYQYYITLKKDGEVVYTSQYLEFTIAEASSTSKYAQYFDGAEISASIIPEDALYAGDNNVLSIDVYNASMNILRNCQVTVKLPEGTTIKNGSNTVNVGYIDPLSTANCSFKISVDSKAETGSKEFVIELKAAARIRESSSYSDDVSYTDKDYSTSKTFYYYVNAKEKKDDDPLGSEANPRLMVQNYSAGSAVAAGSTTNLSLDIVNTSQKTLYNVKVSVSGDGTFVPVGTSNSYFIDKIGAGESKRHTMTLRCDRDTEPGAKGLTVHMDYEDSKGGTFNSEDTISIKVTQPSKLVIGQLTLPMDPYAGEEACVELTFYNMGKNAISNLMVSVDGNFAQNQNNGDFVGNMAAGTDENYACYIVPMEVGAVEGVISLQYDDAEGNTVVEEVPFSFEALEFVPDDSEWEEEPVDEGTQIPWKAIIILAVIVLAVAGALIFRKIRRKKLEQKLAIEDAEYEIDKAPQEEKK